jgi:translation initiation factor 1 (eIF-1/SUI1)
MALTVRGTKKGSFAISVAKRPMGKKVTILTNVSGEGVNALLSELKKKLGTGGTRTAHDTIEVAGDRAVAVEKVLREVYPDALVGVRRLAPPAEKAPTPPTTATTSREPRAKPRHGASTQARRAVPKIVVFSKPKETSKTFQGYRRLMTDWIYWDREVLNLHDMFDRHVREHDTSSLLEEWPTEGGDEVRDGDGVPAHTQSKEERRAMLMDIGMIATPSAFKLSSRLDRRREAAMSAAARKRESSSTTSAFSSSALPSPTSSKMVHFDPATELLREHGFAPARGKYEQTTSQVRAPKTAPKARVSRVTNTKARARPTGGMYTSLRKGVGSFNAIDSRFAERALDSSDEDVDNQPATWRQGFETGFTRDASGEFTFGDEVVRPLPKVDVRNATPSHQSNGGSVRERRYDEHEHDDDDDDDADLIEAMRLSQMEYDTNQEHAMHVECDDLFADMTEEDILAYIISMSEAEAFDANVPIADDESLENMPSRTEWIELRLGELFYPNMDTAREVAQILPAMVGADMTLDLLEGAGASRDDAQAFLDTYASLTLTDTNTHRDGASTTRVDESRVDEFTAWANAFLSQLSREDIDDDAFVEFLAAVEDPTEIAAFILDTFPNADTVNVSAFAHEFAARARRR